MKSTQEYVVREQEKRILFLTGWTEAQLMEYKVDLGIANAKWRYGAEYKEVINSKSYWTWVRQVTHIEERTYLHVMRDYSKLTPESCGYIYKDHLERRLKKYRMPTVLLHEINQLLKQQEYA